MEGKLMSTTYTYSITDDFPNQAANLETLESEVTSAGLSSVLSYINSNETECYFIFDTALSSGDETVLNGVVTNHTGEETSETSEVIVISPVPTPGSKFWLQPLNNIVYCFDEVRDKWLSTNRNVFSFARKGNSRGMYIPLLGDLDAVDDVYMPGKDSTIIGVFCKSNSGDESKGFEIRKNGTAIYTFSYDGSGSLTYSNSDLDLNINASDTIQVFVKKDGGNVINTICRIETAWRYDNE
jgi:hypothetical protein